MILKFYRMIDVEVLDFFLIDHLRLHVSWLVALIKMLNIFTTVVLVRVFIF